MRRAFVIPPRKEGHMVTYSDMIQFVIMITGIVMAVWTISKKK